MNDAISSNLLSREQAAKMLGVSVRHLINLEDPMGIPRIRMGRCVRYSPAALQEWIERQQEKTVGQ
jgi:excisionase family DNA binding protein